MNLKTSKGLFNSKEIVFLLLLEIKGYFAKASDKELKSSFLIYHRYYVLSEFILLSLYRTIFIYIYFFLE